MTVDHTQIALDRLRWQFRGHVNTEALIRVLTAPFADLETAMQDLNLRNVSNATGQSLEVYGKIVKYLRTQELSDDDLYRRVIRARIAVNRSHAAVEDLILVTRLVMLDEDLVVVVQPSTGAVNVEAANVTIDDTLAGVIRDLLALTVAAGIRLIFVFRPTGVNEANAFAFEGGSDGAGFGDLADASVGGFFVDAIE